MEARKQETWDVTRAGALAKASKTLKKMAAGSRSTVAKRWIITEENRNMRKNGKGGSEEVMEVQTIFSILYSTRT